MLRRLKMSNGFTRSLSFTGISLFTIIVVISAPLIGDEQGRNQDPEAVNSALSKTIDYQLISGFSSSSGFSRKRRSDIDWEKADDDLIRAAIGYYLRLKRGDFEKRTNRGMSPTENYFISVLDRIPPKRIIAIYEKLEKAWSSDPLEYIQKAPVVESGNGQVGYLRLMADLHKKEFIPVLAKNLSWVWARTGLISFGMEALPSVESVARDPEAKPHTRSNAVDVILKIAPPEVATKLLIEIFEGEKENKLLKVLIIRELAELGNLAKLSYCREMIEKSEVSTESLTVNEELALSQAVFVLSANGTYEDCQFLLGLSRDSNVNFPWLGLSGLGRFLESARQKVLPILRENLKSPRIQMRRGALAGLSFDDSEEAHNIISSYMTSEKETFLLETAARILAVLYKDDKGLDILYSLASGFPDNGIHKLDAEAAAVCLCRFGDIRGLECLIALENIEAKSFLDRKIVGKYLRERDFEGLKAWFEKEKENLTWDPISFAFVRPRFDDIAVP